MGITPTVSCLWPLGARTCSCGAQLGFGVGLLAVCASNAVAAPALHALPVGPALPGQTLEVRILALDGDTPLAGLVMKGSAENATVGTFEDLGEGLYVVPFTVASSGAPSLTLTSSHEGQAFQWSGSIPVQEPAAAERLALTIDGERFVLGEVTAIKLDVADAGLQGVQVRASVGEVGSVASSGRKAWATFTPPKVNFPQVAVLTAADVGQPTESYGVRFVPLVGSVPFPVKGPAGAEVSLEVDGRSFGPITLGADGKGKVPIEVAPGVTTATQTTVNGGDTSTKALDLGIPATKRIGLVPMPRTVATGSDPFPLRVAVARADGEPDHAADVVFEVSRGTVSKAKHLGDGVYEVDFTPPSTPGEVNVGARVRNDDLQADEGSLTVAKGLDGAVRLHVEPWPAEDEGTVEVTVTGEGVAVSDLQVTVLGGSPSEPTVRDGAKVLTVDAVEADALQVSAGVALDSSSDGVRHVVVLPSRSAAAPGTTVPVLVATVDEGGLPVPKQPVTLSVTRGEGTVPSTVETGDDGRMTVQLSLGEGDEVVALRASSQGYVGEAAVLPVDGLAGDAWASIGPFARAWRALHPMVGPTAAPVADLPWGAAPVPEPVPVPEPEPVAPPVETAEVEKTEILLLVPPESLRFRASAVVSTYRFEQTPSGTPGNVLNRALTVGGSGGTPASPAGFEVDGRVWLDKVSLPYLGMHASLRNTWYSIRSDAFAEPARDQLLQGRVDLLLRYPFDFVEDRFWIGGRGGFHYDDFIFFEGCFDQPSCTVAYRPLAVPGLALGPELGAEIGRVFLIGGYSFGLANFGQPYLHAFDLDAGVGLAGPLFAEVGFGAVSRRVELVGADSEEVRGRLDDTQLLFDFGLGVQF